MYLLFRFIIVIMLCYFLVLNTAPSKEQVRDVRWGSLLGTGTPNVLLKYRFPYKIHNYATCQLFGWGTQFLCIVPYNIDKESVFQLPVDIYEGFPMTVLACLCTHQFRAVLRLFGSPWDIGFPFHVR